MASRINFECGTGILLASHYGRRSQVLALTAAASLTAAAVARHGTAWTVQDVDLQLMQAVLDTEPELEGRRLGSAAGRVQLHVPGRVVLEGHIAPDLPFKLRWAVKLWRWAVQWQKEEGRCALCHCAGRQAKPAARRLCTSSA